MQNTDRARGRICAGGRRSPQGGGTGKRRGVPVTACRYARNAPRSSLTGSQPSGLKAKRAVLIDGGAPGVNQKVSWMWLAVT